MSVPLRPITRIQRIVETAGLSITFAYDDLVFIEHNAFVLQMGEKGEDVFLYFNVQSDENARSGILSKLTDAAIAEEIILSCKGLYEISEASNEELMQLKFFPIDKFICNVN